jgi:hypothetical protein
MQLTPSVPPRKYVYPLILWRTNVPGSDDDSSMIASVSWVDRAIHNSNMSQIVDSRRGFVAPRSEFLGRVST